MAIGLVRSVLGAVTVVALAAVAVANATIVTQQRANLTAYLIPHSHQDAGWLKTIDEYYDQEVRFVYNTVVQQLALRSDRKFIIVEMVFFSRWFREASAAEQQAVRDFVANGQIEFVLGGWCMSDDADPTYSASTNQMAEGHKWIYSTFGVVKGVDLISAEWMWTDSLDPFGLSSYYPTLYAKMGFNAHVINRIHYQQKDQWKASQHMEFVWRGSPSLGQETEMFTHILDSHYSFPSGFNFERDPPITDTNIPTKAQQLVTELLRRSAWYRTPHLLVPGGDDFRWQNAAVQYTNWDKLIDYINARSEQYGVTIKYATLADYFGAVNREPVVWPLYTEDFFPYADNADSYWTGYYTSYSDLKGLIRTRASLLRTAEVFSQAAATISPREGAAADLDDSLLVPLRQANAEAQHHDGVTGTSKAYVAQMYRDHLWDGSEAAEQLVELAMGKLVGHTAPLRADADELATLPIGRVIPVVITNVLGWPLAQSPVDVVVSRPDLEVLDGAGVRIASQIVSIPNSPSDQYLLTFLADVPAAGFATYFVQVSASGSREVVGQSVPIGVSVELSNGALAVNASVRQGALAVNVENLLDNTELSWSQQMLEYTSYTGSGQKSGAYIFRPTGPANTLSAGDGQLTFVNGPLVQELRHKYDNAHIQVIRLFKSANPEVSQFLETRFSVGTLNLDREAIVRLTTSLTSANTRLYTDNNGIEMHQRRPFAGKIEANYYPMVAQSYLSDGERELVALSDRTVGVASLAYGQMEAMLHRRCSRDDGRGVGEALNDQSVVYPRLRFFAGSASSMEWIRPRVSMQQQYGPLPFFGPATSVSEWFSSRTLAYSTMRAPLPDNMHLLAFKTDVGQRWSSSIVRLQHIYEVTAKNERAQPVSVDVNSLFDTAYAVSDELDLSGVVAASSLPRLRWTPSSEITPPWVIPVTHQRRSEALATFAPMQLRVYRLQFA